MSRKNRITRNSALKMRAGQTYWRCQTQRDGTVYISESMLSGSKLHNVMRSMFPEDVPKSKRKILSIDVKIGNKHERLGGDYLMSINPGSSINAFTSRRAALRWKQEVEGGLHPEHVAEAMEHWDMCDDDMRYGLDDSDWYGPMDYIPEPEEAPRTLEGGVTLGTLLRQVLDRNINGTVVPEGVEPLEA